MMNDDIVAGVKAVASIDAQSADVQKRISRFTDRSSKSARRHGDSLAVWKSRAREALAAGEDFNEPPPAEPMSAAARRLALDDFKAEQDALRGARLRAVIDAEPEIEERARKRVGKGTAKAQKAVELLTDALRDVRAGQMALDEIAGAKRVLDQRQPRPHHPARFYGLIDLVQAVIDGSDPLDRFHSPAERKLGMQRSNLDQPPAEIPEPPMPSTDVSNGPRVSSHRTNNGVEL